MSAQQTIDHAAPRGRCALPERGAEEVQAALAAGSRHAGTDGTQRVEVADWRVLAEAGDVEGAVTALAKLGRVLYDRVREEAAKLLGCRLATLDCEVEQRRRQAEEAGRHCEVDDPKPWPEPIDPSDLLDELAAYFRRYAVLPEHGDVVLALWTAHTWVFDIDDLTPRLVVTSPQKGCGKSTVLDLLRAVVRRPIMASHTTPAALFRMVDKFGPTVLLDEADTYLPDNGDLRCLLNAGHHARGAVWRTVGEEHEPRPFPVFAPVAIAAIGGVPDTVADRAVVLAMRRRRLDEPIERFREDKAGCQLLRRKLARFRQDWRDRLRGIDPDVPEQLGNRAADNWRPLLAIAELAGHDWRERARAGALAQAVRETDGDLGMMILADVKRIFEELGCEEIASTVLCDRLKTLEDRPWSEISNGRPITPRRLAILLKPFEIGPHHRRQGNIYRKSDFVDAWSRYLPAAAEPAGSRSCASSHTPEGLGSSDDPAGSSRERTGIDLPEYSAQWPWE